jgi:RecA/RadA recombinase
MKRILLIAGPNGAGKTTFATEFLPNEAACPEFVNADLIAAGLSPFQPEQVAFAAGRLMLAHINELVGSGKSFAFETTLSTRSWLRLIPRWKSLGYRVKPYFLSLPDPDFALRHGYIGIVDEGSIYDGSQDPPLLLEHGDNRPPDNLMEDSAEYRTTNEAPRPVKPLDDPDFIGAGAALRRASAKAVAHARAAGLDPVVRQLEVEKPKP